ncbi:MAG TPA: peptide chain release factor-like protein [Isosphaeraceae bacterium]|jgi:hypothetical protein|nr:peptide chain release factor-like protein [Isosphaeraceae bacterium]
MEPRHPADVDQDHLLAACDVTRTRRSGPGGQNRNKVETAIVLRHRPSGLAAEASERRSQAENLRQALFRLRLNLALEVRSDAATRNAPSLLWQSRCRGGRMVISPEHADFPSILAEALDVVAAHDFDLQEAAEALGCSAKQLTKLLKAEPRALAQVNTIRHQRGQHPLR